MRYIVGSEREKIGNAVIYIANRVSELSKTKLLKLLYIMEEYSVKTYYTPFLGLNFEVWQHGPVAKDIFIDLSSTPVLLEEFINKEITGKTIYYTAKKSFNEDEFSQNDISVMDAVLEQYKDFNASKLVEVTHKEGSLWYKAAKENDLIVAFEEKIANSSDCILDLSELLCGVEKDFYKEQLEFMELSRQCSSLSKSLS
ncbi:MAG: Panacea domain-containing protein [bacterium]